MKNSASGIFFAWSFGLDVAAIFAVEVVFEVEVAFEVEAVFEVPRIENLPKEARGSRELWSTCLSEASLCFTRLARASFGDLTEGKARALRSPFFAYFRAPG
ncbi:MAG: hypothetical protein ABI171_10555 [Collimonas sp.]|uniref:hypothetical protein n=1 Tax=Collimonas sp. TaxID=1963772 RepID=UPI0032633E5F